MPEEVEKAISNLVPQSIAISSIPHHTLGEAVVLVIESAELKNDEKKSLLLHIKKLVHSYAIPKQIYSLSEIPRTPTGKIDRREIKERLK
jgi:acyl-CoA synthetase (AMP-forming)/AMP-acid ligase II